MPHSSLLSSLEFATAMYRGALEISLIDPLPPCAVPRSFSCVDRPVNQLTSPRHGQENTKAQ